MQIITRWKRMERAVCQITQRQGLLWGNYPVNGGKLYPFRDKAEAIRIIQEQQLKTNLKGA